MLTEYNLSLLLKTPMSAHLQQFPQLYQLTSKLLPTHNFLSLPNFHFDNMTLKSYIFHLSEKHRGINSFSLGNRREQVYGKIVFGLTSKNY